MNATQTVFLTLLLSLSVSACDALDSSGSEETDHAAEVPPNGTSHDDNHAEASQSESHDGGQHEGEGHESGESVDRLRLSPEQLQRLTITTAPVERGSHRHPVQVPATAQFNPDAQQQIGTLNRARVVDVQVDLGDVVSAGDTVATLESAALGRARAAHIRATARLEAARQERDRAHRLAEDDIASESEVIAAEAEYTKAQADHRAADAELAVFGLPAQRIESTEDTEAPGLSRYRLVSPVDGRIQARDLVPGEILSPGRTPIHIVNTEVMWIMLHVPEGTLNELDVGQPVRFQPRALPDTSMTGEIDWISSAVDPESRRITVRATVRNPDGLLRGGMYGNAEIGIRRDEQSVTTVPYSAVQNLDGTSVVFVPGDSQGHYRIAEIETGREYNGQIEVTAGLDGVETVIEQGSFDLKSVATAAGRSADHSH